jgi:hypothetical protein
VARRIGRIRPRDRRIWPSGKGGKRGPCCHCSPGAVVPPPPRLPPRPDPLGALTDPSMGAANPAAAVPEQPPERRRDASRRPHNTNVPPRTRNALPPPSSWTCMCRHPLRRRQEWESGGEEALAAGERGAPVPPAGATRGECITVLWSGFQVSRNRCLSDDIFWGKR